MLRGISVIELILMRGKIYLLGRGSLMCHGILRHPGTIFFALEGFTADHIVFVRSILFHFADALLCSRHAVTRRLALFSQAVYMTACYLSTACIIHEDMCYNTAGAS